ncbi:MAG: hypothetical protein HY904_24320 [Deltaproteobacteria bacterium]|nr:hypothetical protein [Deltaproteobacteria bacterium]
MRSWNEQFAQTWLTPGEARAQMDAWVRTRLRGHRVHAAPSLESVAAWSVDLLADDIQRFGNGCQWLWCTTAVGLAAELIFGSIAGGTFPKDTPFRYDLKRVVDALREIRNATVHPAFQNAAAGQGVPPVERLYDILDQDDDAAVKELALRLTEDWSLLADRPLSTFALRQLDAAGRLLAEEYSIW